MSIKDSITIAKKEYERLEFIERTTFNDRSAEAKDKIFAAWDEAAERAVADLRLNSLTEELIENEITVVIQGRGTLEITVGAEGVNDDDDFDYLNERIFYHYAELQDKILTNYGLEKSWLATDMYKVVH